MHKIFLLLFIVLITLNLGNTYSQEQNIINIGNRREIFIDYYLIEKLTNVSLKMNTPHPKECVLKFDKPWEGRYSGYVTLIKDGDLYRLYYRGLPESGKDGTNNEVTCYAESTDGVNFIKPNLGIYTVMGTLENNVILANDPPFSHNFSPFIDTKPGISPKERYKAIAGTSETGLYSFISEDGIHWHKLNDKPILSGYEFDSQNVAFWSETENKYVLYFRTWNGQMKQFRWISRTTSDDFINWESPKVMEKGDAPWEHIYTNQTIPYFRAPHIYISLCARFFPGCNVLTQDEIRTINVEETYSKDCSDVILMTSRGGNIYNRTFLEAFLKPEPGPENWVSRTNYPVRGIVQTSNYEMSFYLQKNYALPTAHLQRYAIRLDGFTSLSAGFEEGHIYTKPIIFSGNQLYLNFATSAVGYIQIEIQDINGKTLPQFSFGNFKTLKGNRVEKIAEWEGTCDLKSIEGNPILIHFKMKDAELYSIMFN